MKSNPLLTSLLRFLATGPALAVLVTIAPLHAAKPDGKGGGGNSGSGTTYSLIDLGVLGEESDAYAANDSGIVVGYTATDGGVYWKVNFTTGAVTRHPLGGVAEDVNAHGEAAGHVADQAALWKGLGTSQIELTLLDAVPSDPANLVRSFARGIADDGLIVGTVAEFNPNANFVSQRGMLWGMDPAGNVSSLEFPGPGATPHDLNSNGLVIGILDGPDVYGGVVWKFDFDGDGNVTGINPPIALADLGDPSTWPSAITEDGLVTGEAESNPTDHEDHAVVWTLDAEGNTTDLLELGKLGRNDNEVGASGIDDAGRIVGNSTELKFRRSMLIGIITKPFLWENGGMINFNQAATDLGGLQEVYSIHGVTPGGIVYGRARPGPFTANEAETHAFVAVPNP